jgi:penicillin-binding protein 1A
VKSQLVRFISFFRRQSRRNQVLLGLLSVFIVITTFFGLLTFCVWTGVFGALPGNDELRAIKNPVATEVYSADSVLLGRYFIQERSDISFQQIPPHVLDALITTEDERFYQHGAVDVKSFFRVAVKSILLGQESSGGGSTLTQQLAKNLYPRKDYGVLTLPVNKIREIFIASRLERIYGKKEILSLYLNTVPFGDNTYGIETASQRFYSRPASQLTVDEGAVLIGMLKATYAYNPRVFPDRSKTRRNVVLNQMYRHDKLSRERMDSLLRKPISLRYNRITHHTGLASYFREFIRQELLEWCKTHEKENGEPYQLYSDGLKVYTTIDSRIQQYAEEAVVSQMKSIQATFDEHWKKKKPWDKQPAILEDAIKRSDRYKALKRTNRSDKEIDDVMNTPVAMTIFTWQGEKDVTLSPVDSIKHYLSFLNAGLLAMDPGHGAIRAWVGGINHHFFQYDHVRKSTKRQVGSTFKPLVYAAALEKGVRPCEFTSAEKTIYTNMEEWTPQNTGGEHYDLKFSMEGALAYSVNTVSVKILEKAGIANTISLAHKMGIESEMPAVPSLALGVADISMTELVTAYACLDNNGVSVKPFYLTSIADAHGAVLEKFHPEAGERVLSAETSQMIIHMLKRTVNEGTGASLRSRYGISNDVAGKTGTTQSNADGWFVAVSPKLVIGAWVGADDPRIRFRSTELGQGARMALPIVAKFYQQANNDKRLIAITSAHFSALSDRLERRLSCDLYKTDKTIIEKIFGKKKKENRQAFGEGKKKEGFFKRLFKKG